MVSGEPPRILAEDRQVTRLGETVFRDGQFSAQAAKLTCQVLVRMAKTLKGLRVLAVRVVATSAVRDAHNRKAFLNRLEDAVGYPVDVISGQEEARLIHLGVQSRWPHREQNLLIVDVGGGSAELIYSEQGGIRYASSKPLGAVRLKEAFLGDDPPKAHQLHQLQDYIHEKLASIRRRLAGKPLARTIATAATASTVACAVHAVPRSQRDKADRLEVSRRQLDDLYRRLSRQTLGERRRAPGIGPRRAEVIVPGCAVLARILEELRLPSFHYCPAGVRDGVVADLAQRGVGREQMQLDGEQRHLVREMARRFGVSLRHVDKVADLSRQLFAALQNVHGQPPVFGRLLEAAAYLHDVGHFVSDSRHHKHSFYVVVNSDLPGFTFRERILIANLCRYHRKALPADHHANLNDLDRKGRDTVLSIIPLLRLADSLDRAHQQRVKEVDVRVLDRAVELTLVSKAPAKLEQWAVERVSNVFEKVYSMSLTVRQRHES